MALLPDYSPVLDWRFHPRDSVTTMGFAAEWRSCVTQKTILMTSGPISIRWTDHVSAPMPVGGCQVRPDCGRELAKTSRRESHVFQVMGIATFLCRPPYAGSSHSRNCANRESKRNPGETVICR